ncbi:CDP-glycerol glycerophosphotransferase family protein [Glutamicibacter sp. PS]|uniref:CDP-glycerol glycerophosphotransferase family protein n=1 Tax=Glutamicibacter sp. PS TaxID=3075634 RepID=UPI00284C9F5C|nr:CDP-glycerol glycerophosphotransferase family protein [Glutamicibacter sp. PS]MDR4532976.1 CDP-glycerol glycerophosphotransferase family protein [Glutamicibacter sp. PS]
MVTASQTLWGFVRKRLQSRSAHQYIQARPSVFAKAPAGDGRYQVALYFADGLINAYQLRQWYEPMRKLAEQVPVVVIVRNASTAVQLHQECPLPLYFAKTIGDIETMLAGQSIGAVYYVNQNIRNFQMIRFNDPTHVFISHGESEKAYMWSNQLKAYDYVFSAGQAARDRLAKNLSRFDAAKRTKLIGRPQIDVHYPSQTPLNPDLPTVLYAPTWEGDRPSMTYGSVASHGVALVESIIASGQYNLIVRPHPRSGINSESYRTALGHIRQAMAVAATDSTATYFYDETADWGWQWAVSDICITDISAAAYDFMATGKPLMIATPSDPSATVDDSPALISVPGLAASEAHRTAEIVAEQLTGPNGHYEKIVEHYFGDTTPGASMDRFLAASLAVLEENKTERENRAAGSN